MPPTSLAGGEPNQPALIREMVRAEEQIEPAETAVAVWLFRPGTDATEARLNDVPDLVRQDENFVWIDLSGRQQTDFHSVAELLHLDPQAVQLSLSPWQRPRLDAFGTHYFVSVTVPDLEPGAQVQAGELDLFIGPNYLCSRHRLPLPFQDRVLLRASHNPGILKHDAAFMLYIVLDELLGYFEQLREQLRDHVENLEERALTDTSERFVRDVLALKRRIGAVSLLLEQNRVVFSALLRPDFSWIGEEHLTGHFRDLEGRILAILQGLMDLRESTVGAFDIYFSQVTRRTNDVVKILTMVSSILFPVSAVIAIFGTSFHGIPIYNETGFAMMVAAIILISLIGLLLYRRLGWL